MNSLLVKIMSHEAVKITWCHGKIIGVVETVVLEDGVLVPYREQVVWTKIGKNSDIAF